MKRITPILGVLVLCSGIMLAQNAPSSQQEQLSFEIGHHTPVVKHPVSLSDAELVALRNSTPAEQGLEGLVSNKPALSIPKPTREGLEAAVVHLNGPAERDLVVIGSGRRYAAGTAPYWILAPFWVIREENGKPKIVLAIFTQQLQILSSKHRGMADLTARKDTGMGTLVTQFEFNGFKYTEGISISN